MLVVLTLLVLVTHNVSGQFGSVHITQVDAPSTVPVGQPLTVSITVSYGVAPGIGEYVIVAVLDHTGVMGKPYPITGSSCTGYTYPDESICSVAPTSDTGDLTVSFTLTAPQAQFFNLCVYAYVASSYTNPSQVSGGDSKVVKVVTSAPVPEFPITELPILIICLTLVSIIVRKLAKART
jgi:hypothetical protein